MRPEGAPEDLDLDVIGFQFIMPLARKTPSNSLHGWTCS